MVLAPGVLCADHGQRFHPRRNRDLDLDESRRSQKSGRDLRFEQARANGIGVSDPRPQQQDLRPNLRREPRNDSLRPAAARFNQCRGFGRRCKILSASRLRAFGNFACDIKKSRGWSRSTRREHDHATTRAQQFRAQRQNVSPQTARDFSGEAN